MKFISDFETTATEIAIDNQYDYVVCGHIHEPKIIRKSNNKGSTLYLNSGDWIENLTALEYHRKKWKLYTHKSTDSQEEEDNDLSESDIELNQQLIANIIFHKNK